MPRNSHWLRIASHFYDLDEYLFKRVSKRFAQRHTLSAFDFYAIIAWKSNRMITVVRDRLKKARQRPSQLMADVFATENDRDKMRKLDAIGGIGIPIASAVLTVCYPDRFTVLDVRAWETLCELERVGELKKMPSGIDGYFDHYLKKCKSLSGELGISLRKLDRALWGWSKRTSILKVAGSPERLIRHGLSKA